MRSNRRILRIACTVLAALLPFSAHADDHHDRIGVSAAQPILPTPVDTSTGSFRHAVQIERPPYYGIEPDVSLQYDSGDIGGLAGRGWRVQGFSEIEQQAPMQSRVKASGAIYHPDVFFLDGMELVDCDALIARDSDGLALSPSCGPMTSPPPSWIPDFIVSLFKSMFGQSFSLWDRTSMKAYTTRVERYLKIRYNASASEWSVWAPDGTLTKYGKTGQYGHWGVSQVKDAVGHQVSYGWSCESGRGSCMPKWIRYNGISIDLVYSSRPDPSSYGDGQSIRQLSSRLSGIDVCVQAAAAYYYAGHPGWECDRTGANEPHRARWYQLRYDPATSDISLLNGIQRYGKDVRVADTTAVSGSSLPAQEYTYRSRQSFGVSTSKWDRGRSTGVRTDSQAYAFVQIAIPMDVDGDGIANECFTSVGGNVANWFIYCRDASGIVREWKSGLTLSNYGAFSWTPIILDLNGDGRSDVCVTTTGISGSGFRGGWEIICALATRIASENFFAQAIYSQPVSGSISLNWHVFASDYDGDGKDDLCMQWISTTWMTNCIRSLGNGRFGDRVWQDVVTPSLYVTSGKALSVDLNGDGKADICYAAAEGKTSSMGGAVYGGWDTHCRLATGDGKFGDPVSTRFSANESRLETPTGRDSNGVGYSNQWNIVPGDFNGDGKIDLCVSYVGGGLGWTVHCMLGNGAGGFDPPMGQKIVSESLARREYYNAGFYIDPGYQWNVVPGDYDGDHRTDLCISFRGSGGDAGFTGWRAYCALSKGAVSPDGTLFQPATAITFDAENWCEGPYDQHLAVDFDGDGVSDLYDHNSFHRGDYCMRAGFYESIRAIAISQYDRPLLRRIANGLGGTISVEYSPSSQSKDSRLPGVVDTIKSITVDDGRSAPTTTRYEFDGGVYNRQERHFHGFTQLSKWLPCPNGLLTDCGLVFIQFSSEPALAGQVVSESIMEREAVGAAAGLLRRTKYTYMTAGDTRPYFAHRITTEVREYVPNDLTTSVRTESTRYRYDDEVGDGYAWKPGYGNLVQQCDFGNEADWTRGLAFNTLCTDYQYYPNRDVYIVSKKARAQTTSGPFLIANEQYVYDGASDGWDGGTTPAWQKSPVQALLSEERRWLNTTGTYVTSKRQYTPSKNLWKVIGPATASAPSGAVTEYVYDSEHDQLPVEIRNPLYASDARQKRTVSQTDFDWQCWLPSRMADENGIITEQSYDALCRPIDTRVVTSTATILTKHVLYIGYDVLACASSTTCRHQETRTPGPPGHSEVSTAVYTDGLGRTYQERKLGKDDIVTETSYDGRGNVASIKGPWYSDQAAPGATTRQYDVLNRVTAIQTPAPSPSIRTRAYGLELVSGVDEYGSTASTFWMKVSDTDELGHQRENVVDSRGKLRFHRERDSLGAWQNASYEYVASSWDQTTIKDPLGNETLIVYDSLARIRYMTDADRGTWISTYDDEGHLVQLIDALSQKTSMFYDAIGRLTAKTLRSGTSAAETCTFAYDEASVSSFSVGHKTTDNCISSGVRRTFEWDPFGNQVAETWSIGPTSYRFTSLYDQTGTFVLGRGFPDSDFFGDDPANPGTQTELAYDAFGRLSTVPGLVQQFAYTAWGMPSQQINVNGSTTSATYDPVRHWITAISTNMNRGNGAPLVLQDLTYVRDAEGNVTTTIGPQWDDGWQYTYDSRHELLHETNTRNPAQDQRFDYDNIGNIKNNTALGAYVYPSSGASAVRPRAVMSIGAQSYSYDANGNMTNRDGGTITYDGENRLLTVGGVTMQYVATGEMFKRTSSAGAILYLKDGYEVDLTTGTATKYLVVEGRSVAKRVGSTAFWLHDDEVGSVNVITDTSGEVYRQSYSAYGEPRRSFGAHKESLGFAGKRYDRDTGLIYLGARSYDPKIGRFLTPDAAIPAVILAALNPYAYAYNNPIAFVDPSGYEPQEIGAYYQVSWRDDDTRLHTVEALAVGEGRPWENNEFTPLAGAKTISNGQEPAWHAHAAYPNSWKNQQLWDNTTFQVGVKASIEAAGQIGGAGAKSRLGGELWFESEGYTAVGVGEFSEGVGGGVRLEVHDSWQSAHRTEGFDRAKVTPFVTLGPFEGRGELRRDGDDWSKAANGRYTTIDVGAGAGVGLGVKQQIIFDSTKGVVTRTDLWIVLPIFRMETKY